MPVLGGFPLVEKETKKPDGWLLELGLHLTGAEAQKVQTFI